MVSVGRQFAVQATLRALLLLGMMLTLSFLVFRTELVITPLVAATVCVGLLVEFVFFVQRTNREVARFFDSIRHADFSHRVDPALRGAGFVELADSMRSVVDRLQAMRRAGEQETQRLRAIVEHVPVPMFSVVDRERVVLHNHAARRFFSAAPVTTVADLERFGADLTAAIREQRPGQSRLVRLAEGDATPQRMSLLLTEIRVGREHQRLVTLQNISGELDASELEAWQQMAQVLAHEIMNSLTPVASLAGTAQTLLEDGTAESVAGARDAIGTVAQRAESLMEFVKAYRRFSRLPAPTVQRLPAADLFAAMAAVLAPELSRAGIALHESVRPASLTIQADREQLEQVLINLLRNAMAAVEQVDEPAIWLGAGLTREGRPMIEVADNGPGVAAELREKVFVPFYSTRKGGSGVGLALTRQVMIGHGGTVRVGRSAQGGALFSLLFP